MKTRTLVVITLGLALAAGCKKKEADNKGTTGSGSGGSAAMKPPEGSGGSGGSGGSAAMKPPEPPKPTPKTGKDLAQVYLDCGKLMGEGKMDDFLKQCSTDTFVAHMADFPDQKRDEAIAMMKDMRTAFPDAKMQPQVVFVNGRNVAAVQLVTGTHEGTWKTPMGDQPATKKKYGALFYHRLAMNDENKATEEWSFMDPATIWGQLGLSGKDAPPVRPMMDKGLDAPMIVVAADDDKEKKNLEIVKKSMEAFAAKKSADSMAAWADDAVESDQASAADVKGKKEIQKGMEMFQKAFPDLKMEMPTMWAAGDYVVAEGTWSGTNDGAMGKMPKTGKKVTGQFAEIYELKDGKITKVWRYRNGLAMAMQLGLVKMPAAGDMKGGDMKGGDMKGGDAKKPDPAKK